MADQDLLGSVEALAGPGPGDAPLAFACPRCASQVSERFYGPCQSCRDELADALRTVAREVQVESYAPKMNVVPNHVATKE